MESAAALDALLVLQAIEVDDHARGIALLTEIVAMLTPLSGIRRAGS